MSDAKRLRKAAREARSCQRCDLWRNATQVVFGDGPADAMVMFVGEQPGDREDIAGEPFVGPAGRLLRAALLEAGIAVEDVYLTNAVKHFKWKPRGKRRIHERPNTIETRACHFWLEQEIAAVQPRILVAMGATAAAALFGPAIKVTRDRGKKLALPHAAIVTVTVHPSSILRAGSDAARAAARQAFVGDLRKIAGWLRRS